MLRASIIFFCLGLLSMFLGANGLAGLSINIGKTLLGVFIVLAVISFAVSMITGRKNQITFSLLLLTSLFFSPINLSWADDSIEEKADEVASDSKRAIKQAVRKVKDETCTLTKGKMECAAEKVKHSVQEGVDNIEDAVE